MNNRGTRLARVCYNDNGWIRPSGEQGKSKNGCFEDKKGFGFDEWINTPIFHDGYCYAFIQGVPITNKRTYHYDRIKLFAYSDGKWFYEGYIDNVDTLLDNEAEVVLKDSVNIVQNRTHDLISLAEEGICRFSSIDFYKEEVRTRPHNVLNVKFLKQDFHFSPNVEVPSNTHPNGYRYLLFVGNE